MQVLKVGVLLVFGIAAAACGGGSDGGGDGGGDDDDSGGSSGSGGSSNGGSSSGRGGSSSGGSSSGGSSSGGSSNGGSSSGGTTGVGGTSGAGSVCLFDVPECEDFFSCVFEEACAQTGAQQQACIDALKQVYSESACYPAGTDLATACNMVRKDPQFAMTYPDCVD